MNAMINHINFGELVDYSKFLEKYRKYVSGEIRTRPTINNKEIIESHLLECQDCRQFLHDIDILRKMDTSQFKTVWNKTFPAFNEEMAFIPDVTAIASVGNKVNDHVRSILDWITYAKNNFQKRWLIPLEPLEKYLTGKLDVEIQSKEVQRQLVILGKRETKTIGNLTVYWDKIIINEINFTDSILRFMTNEKIANINALLILPDHLISGEIYSVIIGDNPTIVIEFDFGDIKLKKAAGEIKKQKTKNDIETGSAYLHLY